MWCKHAIFTRHVNARPPIEKFRVHEIAKYKSILSKVSLPRSPEVHSERNCQQVNIITRLLSLLLLSVFSQWTKPRDCKNLFCAAHNAMKLVLLSLSLLLFLVLLLRSSSTSSRHNIFFGCGCRWWNVNSCSFLHPEVRQMKSHQIAEENLYGWICQCH